MFFLNLSLGFKVRKAPELIGQIPQNAMTTNKDKVWPERTVLYKINPDLGKPNFMQVCTIKLALEYTYGCV